MTPIQLRQWLFQNSKEDQWWLCLDGVTEELPVSLAEIQRLIGSGEYARTQVLHTSQAEIANPPWIDVTQPAAFAVPATMKPQLAMVAPIAAPALSAALPSPPDSDASKPDETLGIIILLIPLIGVFLIWFSPVTLLLPLSALTVASTAILVGVEANKLGIGKGKKYDKKGREKRESGPIGWAVLLLAFWIIGFPYYLYWRSRYGAKNMLVGGIGVALLFFGILVLVSMAAESSRSRADQVAERLQQEASHLEAQFVEPKSTISQEQAMRKRLVEIANDSMQKCKIASDSGDFESLQLFSNCR